ncbi:uncharacterized protein PV09_08932 [Verruconis gallopava]|uniref:DUF155 domain-containing protein n=1 Tax=Verruconis gallopava TaxID=253628 RepID=A0A0D1ZY38_9PEZI|nr:uncharacterized protein PV09_08932 [Verruconis gallopava]KIV99387.1 hypothetical protein PV09_08932 [Verruconis gallopava]
MASTTTATESTPLIANRSSLSSQTTPPKPPRTVTFNPTVSTSSPSGSVRLPLPATATSPAQSGILSNLNNKLRRRHSQGAPYIPPNLQGSRIGPQRTTKNAEKLKILPDPDHGEDGADEESGREVYSQFTRITDPTARRDAARLGKADRDRLPRVTAYCTAGSYRLDDLTRFLKGKARSRGAAPKRFDECLYTPYRYEHPAIDKPLRKRRRSGSQGSYTVHRRYSDSVVEVDGHEQRRDDLVNAHGEAADVSFDGGQDMLTVTVPDQVAEDDDVPDGIPGPSNSNDGDLDIDVDIPEIFIFDYGTVVIWGMTQQQEHRFLKEISKFEEEKLDKDAVQTEDFNFYYTKEYQARIYNDFISLRDKKNYMTKLAISHALSQSVKTSLYESLVDATIEATKDLPTQLALTGRIALKRQEINMQIGELFILRINIHLQGSILDTPELMWAEPQLEPVYLAVRSYLEMNQRVELLTDRLGVLEDLLRVLKEQLGQTHGEYLEWIVVVLIAAEILVAAVNIVVDLYAGVD